MFHLCRFIFIALFGNALSQGIADVRIISASGSNATGHLIIEEIAVGAGVHITGTVIGLLPGNHGFHIHQSADLGSECQNAGGHFNPFGRNHGAPEDANRHVGDLGNIKANQDGMAKISISDSLATLNPLSKAYVGNLSIVIHAGTDDLGLGLTAESQRTGNAGARVGCGQIIMRHPEVPKTRLRIIQATGIYNTPEDVKNIRALVKIVPGVHIITGQLEVHSLNEGVHITGTIYGLSPGLHGCHIHQKGELGNACVDAGGHFNPYQRNHGAPEKSERHVGDLGNIFSDVHSIAQVNIYDDHASLNPLSPAYIGERSLVVHAAMDDLGLGQNENSLSTGNAGARSGCGKITVVLKHQTNQFPPTSMLPEQQTISVFKQSATVSIVPGGSTSTRGDISLEETMGGVSIRGIIEGLSPGLHGFHIHETGSLDNNCVGAGGHFNPFKRNHGSPSSSNRHVGDLGNIFAESNGVATIQMHDTHISLNPASISFIGNRAIVVHAGPDDLGRGRNEGSLKTGNAGSRVACGIITMEVDPVNQAGKSEQQPLTGNIRHIIFPSTKEAAFANIIPGSSRAVRGQLQVVEEFKGVRIEGRIEGLTPGLHGFHVHQKGSLENKCVGAGSHFNPFRKTHGHPDSFERHVGDLGNIHADASGVADIKIYDDHISLEESDPAFIGGRAFVVHAGSDDMGQGKNAESLKTGNAGARVGCGIIMMSKLKDSSLLQAQQQDFRAMAIFIPGKNKNIEGKLTLTQQYRGVMLTGQITGLTPGLHGFHIHQSGDLANECSNAGQHFNPFKKNHGSPHADERHIGDLGNIEANVTGVALVNIFDQHISLDPKSPAFVGDRSFVVHSQSDDLGRASNEESLRTGNAGSRDGCANIIIDRPSDIVLSTMDVDNFSPPQFVKSEETSSRTEENSRYTHMPDEKHLPVLDAQEAVYEPQYATSFHHQTFAGQVREQPIDSAVELQPVLFGEPQK